MATPQTEAGGNRALLIAPNGRWLLATSPRAPWARLIDIRSGITLRFLAKQGLEIAGLSISPDSETVFARGYDGQIVAWNAATGQLVANAATTTPHDVTKLSFLYDLEDENKATLDDLVSRYHLRSHFPQLKKFDAITINPTREYAIVGNTGDPEWQGFQIWNLKKEKGEVFFRLTGDRCGYHPSAFDYDGKHLVFGNSGGESDPAHLDFVVFEINYSGPDVGPKTATATPSLGARCNNPFPGLEREFAISPDARYLTRGGGMPGSNEWAAWDLRNGKKVASIRPDGHGTVSSDGGTFAVLHEIQRDGSRSKQSMTVLHDLRKKTFKIPQSMQADNWRPLVLSANGKWIASKSGATVAVWNTDGGRKVREYRVGDKSGDILRVSNSGDPLLVSDDDGTALVNGAWQPVRSDPHSLIVPVTPNFHPQCGVIFCDRVVAELGVVERKRVDHSTREPGVKDLSPDGRFVITRHGYSQNGVNKGTDISDVTDRRVVLHIDEDRLQFTPDGQFIVVRDFANSFVKYDLATAKRLWTTIPNSNQNGFNMFLMDGRVRFSPSRYRGFQLVRGFEIHRFDDAAAKAFVAPPER